MPVVGAPPATDATPKPATDAAAFSDADWLARAATGTLAETSSRPVALGWVDDEVLTARRAPQDLSAASSAYVPVLPDLVRRRRSGLGALLTVSAVLALAGGYTAATQLWSLDNVVPVVEEAEPSAVTAPASDVAWPAQGEGAVGIDGVTGVTASSDDAVAMASITKLVTALMVLEQQPLAAGEQGAEREITYSDRVDYWGFLARGESALNVPVGATLTEYQLLQGTLIASAGNYAEMLTRDLWPTDAEFAAAAREWLDRQGLAGITVVEPTGIDRANTADAASLIRLGEIALADPVIAEIVATEVAELPGVGEIRNTNSLLADDDTVVGIKTGGLNGHYNLLAAAEVPAGETTVRVYAVVLGQPVESLRVDETAALLEQIAAEATVPQTLPAGTTVGTVTTAWGTESGIVTTADASVLLWNGSSASAAPEIELGEARTAGATVGSATLAGPLDSASTDLTLTDDLGAPDFWWRLTHPLDLLGLAG